MDCLPDARFLAKPEGSDFEFIMLALVSDHYR